MSNDKYHILLVDDDDKIRDLLQKYLIENDYIEVPLLMLKKQ